MKLAPDYNISEAKNTCVTVNVGSVVVDNKTSPCFNNSKNKCDSNAQKITPKKVTKCFLIFGKNRFSTRSWCSIKRFNFGNSGMKNP